MKSDVGREGKEHTHVGASQRHNAQDSFTSTHFLFLSLSLSPSFRQPHKRLRNTHTNQVRFLSSLLATYRARRSNSTRKLASALFICRWLLVPLSMESARSSVDSARRSLEYCLLSHSSSSTSSTSSSTRFSVSLASLPLPPPPFPPPPPPPLPRYRSRIDRRSSRIRMLRGSRIRNVGRWEGGEGEKEGKSMLDHYYHHSSSNCSSRYAVVMTGWCPFTMLVSASMPNMHTMA